jgi:hypothetical protein
LDDRSGWLGGLAEPDALAGDVLAAVAVAALPVEQPWALELAPDGQLAGALDGQQDDFQALIAERVGPAAVSDGWE